MRKGEMLDMNKTQNVMGTKPVFPLLMSMAIPPMVSMLIQSMYNVVDSIFVAQLGEDALTAVSLAFPLQNLVLSAAVGMGIGLNAGIARNIGAGKQDMVNKTATHGIVFTAIHTIIFILIGLFGVKPFFRFFTDDPTVFRWGCQYTYIVICLSFGCLFHIAIEKMFQATGKMVMPMIIQAVGAIINIILDPILIFGLFGFPALKIQGAAIATVVGQISACVLSIIFFCKNSGGIYLKFKNFKFDRQITKQLYMVAIPSGIMTSMPSILVGVLNGIISAVSGTAVAVLGIYFKLQTFVYMPANGVIQGMRPLISYNYGAGLHHRLRQVLKVSVMVSGTIMIFGTILFVGIPEQILAMFNANAEMMRMGVQTLRIIGLGFIVSTIGIVYSGVFESLGRGIESLMISLLRQLVIIVPLSIVFLKSFGLAGVWATFPIAETVSAIIAIFLLKRTMKKMSINFIDQSEKVGRS